MVYQRPPAPADLVEIEAFCNSAAILHHRDAFAGVETARAWLAEHTYASAAEALDSAGLARLVDAREIVRGHLDGDTNARPRLNDLAAGLLTAPRWGATGAAALPVSVADPVLAVVGGVVSVLAVAEISNRRARLKVCRSRECRWVYYDRSPANNSTWCSMDVCGARNKMRAYRSRRDG